MPDETKQDRLTRPARAPNPDRPLMYNLGAFFGEIIKAVRTPVEGTPRTLVRRETREAEVHTPDGPVKVRRTVIDEVER